MLVEKSSFTSIEKTAFDIFDDTYTEKRELSQCVNINVKDPSLLCEYQCSIEDIEGSFLDVTRRARLSQYKRDLNRNNI